MINDTKDPKQQTAGGRELKNAADAAGNLKQAASDRRDPQRTKAGGHDPHVMGILCLGAFQVGVAYIFFTSGTRYTDPVTASVINALDPILNPILVMLFYGERLGRLSILGAAIVLCGILYYNLKKSRQK